jgi:hypothetical protein
MSKAGNFHPSFTPENGTRTGNVAGSGSRPDYAEKLSEFPG